MVIREHQYVLEDVVKTEGSTIKVELILGRVENQSVPSSVQRGPLVGLKLPADLLPFSV